jgi:hypothetical protein
MMVVPWNDNSAPGSTATREELETLLAELEAKPGPLTSSEEIFRKRLKEELRAQEIEALPQPDTLDPHGDRRPSVGRSRRLSPERWRQLVPPGAWRRLEGRRTEDD